MKHAGVVLESLPEKWRRAYVDENLAVSWRCASVFVAGARLGYLVNTYPRTALALLDKYFALGDHFDKAQAFLDQAEAHLTLGAQAEAIQSLKNALQREHEFPNLKTQAWSRYALLVAQKRLDHLYDNALQVLRENPLQSHSFPVDGFVLQFYSSWSKGLPSGPT